METGKHRHHRILLVLLAGILILGVAGGAWAAAPVTVTTAVTGDPVPGATVTAKATVAITDGSSLVSIKWTQNGGPAATLTNSGTDTVTVALPNR
jgi:multidrug efflux pump subunit AcrA (membrane-fusion protein)